jgi:type IV pilus assembly protein PilN
MSKVVQIHLNVASKPFGRRRAFWLAAWGSALLLTLVAVWFMSVYFLQGRRTADDQDETALRAQLNALQAEESQLLGKLAEPGNEQVLARSQFLNQLLYRKGISWTRTFADLEEVLPPRVLVVFVRPEVTHDNNVLLDMQVGAETPADFIELLKVLEESQAFGSPDVRSTAPPSENSPLFQYRLLVSYDQKL